MVVSIFQLVEIKLVIIANIPLLLEHRDLSINISVVILNKTCHVLHKTYLNVIPIKQFVIFMMFWEVLV